MIYFLKLFIFLLSQEKSITLMIGSLVCFVEWGTELHYFKGDSQVSDGKSFSDLIYTAVQMGAQDGCPGV